MAHFAEIDESNIVQRVLVVPNEEEYRGEQFLSVDLLLGGTWIKTSYNRKIRKNFAGIGYTYDPVRDAFIPPQPYPSWLLNEEACQWFAPVHMPKGGAYMWDESTTSWRKAKHA